ncbi:MAG: hypothetical protein ACLUOS_16585 [Odoribacter splanchnicus]
MTGHEMLFLQRWKPIISGVFVGGGFLHADDNYGLAQAFRREMKKCFLRMNWLRFPGTSDF